MKLPTRILGSLVAMTMIVAGWLTVASPASAATLTEVTNFGPNPTNLRMHLYVPDTVSARPAVLVAAHYCTGTGPVFHQNTEFSSLADQYGFIVVYPTANRDGNCFDVSSPETLTHDGGSDSLAVVSMVNHVLDNHNADPDRVYVTGLSSGAMLTNVLLGAYPDVFAAGAAYAGVPFGCFATSDGSMWNSTCADGQLIRSAQEWGDLVRAAYPGYNGPWPRMQLWHGTNDDTLRYPNFEEEIKQWTDVHGLSQTPSSTDRPRSSWTRTRYGGTGTMPPVEAVSVEGGPHNVLSNGMAARTIAFFGLAGTTPPTTTPPTTTPPTTTPPTSTPPTTTPPTTTPPSGGDCRVTYSGNAWNSGLVANLTLTNTGTTALNGWSLEFSLPAGQSIISGWNATYSPSSGRVTATNMSYNATIAPGGSVTFGFQASHTGNSDQPGSYALNGTACAVA